MKIKIFETICSKLQTPKKFLRYVKFFSDLQGRQFQAGADEGRVRPFEAEVREIDLQPSADHPQEEAAPLVVCKEFNFQTRLQFRQKGCDLQSRKSCGPDQGTISGCNSGCGCSRKAEGNEAEVSKS